MTPEQARQLLEGTTPGPWEAESLTYDEPAYPEPIVELQVTAHNGNQVAARSDFDSDAYEPSLNFDLIAAAPGMAEMIAGMTAEYAVQVRRSDGWQYSREEDDFRWQPLTVQIVRADRDHPDEETRLVRRYVTAPQPLGEEQ